MKKIQHILVLALATVLFTHCEAQGPSACTIASFTPPVASSGLGIGQAVAADRGLSVAQSFLVTMAGSVNSVSVPLTRTGTFTRGTQTLIATIEGNNTIGSVKVPNDVPIGTSQTIDPANIPTTEAAVTFSFPSSVSLAANTVYWIRIKGSYGTSNANYITWAAYLGNSGGYEVNGTYYSAVYETNVPNNFSNTDIGTNLFLVFNIGC